jgi:hypothetical protein
MTLPHENLWPDHLKIPLLRAAFLQNEAGLRAWESWKARVDMEDYPDLGAFRLLPRLYHNLQALGVDDPVMMKLKGIVRQGWVKNRHYFRDSLSALSLLGEAGIEALLLFGPALALHYQTDYVIDEDRVIPVLVRPDKAVKAMTYLMDHGWLPEARLPRPLIESYARVGFMHFFQDVDQRRLQLHWHLLPECSHAAAAKAFWEPAMQTLIQDIPVYTLASADQLLHICVQDTASTEASVFLRAIDAMTVLATTEKDLDWERFVGQVRKHRLSVPVNMVLAFLQDNLDAPVPQEVWQQLQAIPVSRREKAEYRAKNSPFIVWRRFSRLWFNYLRRGEPDKGLKKLFGFPRYLKTFWRLGSLREVPIQAITAAWQRLRN